MAKSTTKKSKSPVASAIELVLTVAVAVGLALLIQAFIVKPYRIPSGSMIPTLDIGQRVLANRLDTQPSLGDVVVFHPPQGEEDVKCLV
jgi:signal peptidase I